LEKNKKIVFGSNTSFQFIYTISSYNKSVLLTLSFFIPSVLNCGLIAGGIVCYLSFTYAASLQGFTLSLLTLLWRWVLQV